MAYKPSRQPRVRAPRPSPKHKALATIPTFSSLRRAKAGVKVAVSIGGAIATATLWIMFPRLLASVSQVPSVEITKTAFSQLHDGMPYSDCVAIIGSKGRVTLDKKTPAIGHMTQVEWKTGEIYGTANLLFVDGRLYSKTWFTP